MGKLFNLKKGKKLYDEIILEINWKMKTYQGGAKIDDHFEIMLGRMWEKLIEKYPIFKRNLNNINPSNITHMFSEKTTETGCTFLIGPGVVQFAGRKISDWNDFLNKSLHIVDLMFKSHPILKEFIINKVKLSFITDINIELINPNITDFIREMTGVDVKFPEHLFTEVNVSDNPVLFNNLYLFPIPGEEKTEGVSLNIIGINKPEEKRLEIGVSVQSLKLFTSFNRKDITTWIKKSKKIESSKK